MAAGQLARTRMAPAMTYQRAPARTLAPALTSSCRASVRVCASPRPVIAFRDVHRAQQLMDMADEFTDLWVKGKLNGMDPTTMKALDGLVDDTTFRAVTLTPTKVNEQKGISGMEAKLVSDNKNLRFGKYDIIAKAANDDADVAYALVEVSFLDDNATERKGYQIWKLDIMLDDSVRRVTAVTERGMLDPRGLAGPVGRQAAVFPLDRIQKSEVNREKALAAIQSWAEARNSGVHAPDVLGEHLASDFVLWDVSGSLPGLWASERGTVDATATEMANAKANEFSCALDKTGTLDFIWNGKEQYDMHTTLVDTAVSATHNIGFSHWRSTMKPKGDGKESRVEGTEVEFYTPEGQLKGIWMFRDVMDFERKMLKEDGEFL